jgi:adenine-specific DNA glycosylase
VATAAAICALALDHDVIPLDVNILRILERSLGATELEPPPGHAHDLTQGLFDLGATVCLARIPRCEPDRCQRRSGHRIAPTGWQDDFRGSIAIGREENEPSIRLPTLARNDALR